MTHPGAPAANRFLFVFANHLARPGEPPFTAAVYEDEPPTPAMLKQLPPVLYRRRLEGRWAEMPLSELLAEYARLAAAGTLPPTNMVPPPRAPERPRPRLTPREKIEALVARHRRRGA
jgi:hypothetical protein